MTKPLITVGFSTTSDPGAWYTLNVFLSQHPHLRSQMEFVIVDNSRAGCPISAEFEKHVAANHKWVRYIRAAGPPSSCLYKERLFREATGDIVICMDSHVFLLPGTVNAVLSHLQHEPESKDLLMAVIHNAAGHVHGTNQLVYTSEDYPVPENAEVHHGIVCRGGAFGVWVHDPRAEDVYGPPFEIQMAGTWFMACRRAAWPGFHPLFHGFGGNELYLLEQFRRNGGRVLCHPACRGVHNFSKAHGSGYVPLAEDKVRNYLVAALALDRVDMYNATLDYFGKLYPEVVPIAEQKAKSLMLGAYDAIMPHWRKAGGDVGGAIPRPLFEKLCGLPPAARTLEFGCGLSTLGFDLARTQHTAIEHEPKWIERLKPLLKSPVLQVLHCPIVDGWYDWRPNGDRYDVILVDGPPGSIGRQKCVEFIPAILAARGIVVIDDTHREAEQRISDQLAQSLNYRRERVPHGKRAFDVLHPNP